VARLARGSRSHRRSAGISDRSVKITPRRVGTEVVIGAILNVDGGMMAGRNSPDGSERVRNILARWTIDRAA